MKSLKDLLGPIRTNKKERKEALIRQKNRQKKKIESFAKYGPDKSIINQFKKGKISRSSLKKIPIKPYKPMVKDEVSIFKKNNKFTKTKGNIMGDDFFK